MTKPQRKTKDQVWLDHYRQCLTEGGSITSYAKKAGINVSSFHSAVKRLKTKEVVPNNSIPQPFVKVIQPSSLPPSSIRITLPSGTLLEIENIALNDQCVQFIQTLDQSFKG